MGILTGATWLRDPLVSQIIGFDESDLSGFDRVLGSTVIDSSV